MKFKSTKPLRCVLCNTALIKTHLLEMPRIFPVLGMAVQPDNVSIYGTPSRDIPEAIKGHREDLDLFENFR